MRRSSDVDPGRRNGRGRRARDRLLSGEPPTGLSQASSELEHLLYFAGDDLRGAALAMGGIERFLLAAEAMLADGPTAESVAELVVETDVDDRLGDLECTLGSLLHALERLREALGADAAEAKADARGPQTAGYETDMPTLKSA